MCAWNWAVILTIVGASLEVVGLSFVFIELAFIRSHEFGTAPPMANFARRVRQLFSRAKHAEGSAVISPLKIEVAAEGVAHHGRPTPDATDRERIEWIENYLTVFDSERVRIRRELREAQEATIAEAGRLDQEMKDTAARVEADRKAKLRPSIQRQTIGAVLVLAGLAIGTVGNVI